MIECVNGNGQGCCDICLHIKGWHREWSSSLYYVRNKHGLYLRIFGEGDRFSTNKERGESSILLSSRERGRGTADASDRLGMG